MITIEVVRNGYICNINGHRDVYNEKEIELLFSRLLQAMTGKASSFSGDMFGEIRVNFDFALRK